MALTPSTMLPLGTAAPDFSLPDVVTGKTVARASFDGQALLVIFLCRHCPYVKHVEHELSKLGYDYAAGNIAIVGISANDAEAYPADAPASLAEWAKAADIAFPILYDETQAVARAYHAACTPDFFLFDAAHKLAYRGQLDNSRPGNGIPVTGADLRYAMCAVLDGRHPSSLQKPSLGCNIKWKAA
ncbi:MAG: thioredoxin family protein [Verrucomicrobium sp.]|nr:thioredoxin family protein [Verrucomicrobium sp.]